MGFLQSQESIEIILNNVIQWVSNIFKITDYQHFVLLWKNEISYRKQKINFLKTYATHVSMDININKSYCYFRWKVTNRNETGMCYINQEVDRVISG